MSQDRANRLTQWLFHLSGLSGVLFVLTVFLMLSTAMSDQNSFWNDWLDRYGMYWLLGEMTGVAIFGLGAMLCDQLQPTLHKKPSDNH